MISLYTNFWEIENIDTVIFDKDGTFIDSHIYWGRIIERRVMALIKQHKIEEKYFKTLCLSLGYDIKCKKLIEQGPIALFSREEAVKSLSIALENIGIESKTDEIEEIFKQEHELFQEEIYDYIKTIDEAIDLFSKLKKKNIKMAVVTSDTYSNTMKTLEYLKIKEYFDLIIGKEDCDESKKTGKPAIKALRLLKSDKKNTICVGDAPMDSDMGKNAGLIASILVSTGQIPQNKLKEHSLYTVNSLSEVNIK